MHVTSAEFARVLPRCRQLIYEADFVAIDAEFSGLCGERRNNGMLLDRGLDSVAKRYSTRRASVQEFTVLQFGIVPFKVDPVDGVVRAWPFNFDLFRRPCRGVNNGPFGCSSSSLQFLSEHGFDFNRMVQSGVSFMPRRDREEIWKELLDTGVVNGARAMRANGTRHASVEDCVSLASAHGAVHEWLNQSPVPPELVLSNLKSGAVRDILAFELSEYVSNGGGERLSHHKARRKSQHSAVHMENTLTLTAENSRKDVLGRVQRDVSLAYGLTGLIDSLSSSGKPVVGHNMLLDLMHMQTCFSNPQLPTSVQRFAESTTECYPTIFDTKVISQHIPSLRSSIPSTGLRQLYETTGKRSFLPDDVWPIVCGEGHDRYTKHNKPHEAGFDAFMTGSAFTRMLTKLNAPNLEQWFKHTNESSLCEVRALQNIVSMPNARPGFSLRDPLGCETSWRKSSLVFTGFADRDISRCVQPFGNYHKQWLTEPDHPRRAVIMFESAAACDEAYSVLASTSKADSTAVERASTYEELLIQNDILTKA